MTDGPLVIPANTVQTFHQQYTVPSNRSFVSICPHMHHVGVSFKVWYEYMGDSIPLDRHPALGLPLAALLHLPDGAADPGRRGDQEHRRLRQHARTTRTTRTIPPQTVQAGSTTADEMFLCYFIWTNYQAGDEDIVLDSTIFAGTPEQ